MAMVLKDDPRLMVRLTATSVILYVAVAKLNAYRMDLISELRRDAEYVEMLTRAYQESAETDELFAERLSHVSAEVDQMMMELATKNDRTEEK
ncbi:hypothetical protein GCM10025857_14660 [Alicyclobacillus contaminans]|uniref:hypothetical protein n=1 Tax=Alicyclobacillus contaminans TaxID=392016 RepID=UPI00047BE46F|nr:hypothetical protein [Alicyclobacillus contaminans]GMA50109.1 hypothetical protein GCM10025857_14660 [Alicyclobacillus contaminans]